jgi:hypothetical protein
VSREVGTLFARAAFCLVTTTTCAAQSNGIRQLAKATYAINYFVRLHGHRGSFTGARQLVGHKGGVFKRLFDRNLYFMAHRHTRYVPNVHARQTRLPRCKCDQHRRRRRRWYPNATVAVGHVEPLGTVAACAVFSSNLSKSSKLLHSIPHLPSRIFEKS